MPAWLKIAAIVLLPLLFVSPSLATSDFDPDETQRLYFEALDTCEQTGYDKTQPSCKIHLIYGQELSNKGWCQSGAGKRPAWYKCEESIALDSQTISSIFELLKHHCEFSRGDHVIDACYLNQEIQTWIMSNMCQKENSEGHDLTWVRCQE